MGAFSSPSCDKCSCQSKKGFLSDVAAVPHTLIYFTAAALLLQLSSYSLALFTATAGMHWDAHSFTSALWSSFTAGASSIWMVPMVGSCSVIAWLVNTMFFTA